MYRCDKQVTMKAAVIKPAKPPNTKLHIVLEKSLQEVPRQQGNTMTTQLNGKATQQMHMCVSFSNVVYYMYVNFHVHLYSGHGTCICMLLYL